MFRTRSNWDERTRRPARWAALALGGLGVVLVAAGATLPWVVDSLPPRAYVLGMDSGLERLWVRRLVVLVGLGSLAAAVLGSLGRPSVGGAVLAATGLVGAWIAAATGPFAGRWPAAAGVYVTLIGSLVLTAAGIVGLAAHRVRERRSTWGTGG